MAVARIGPNAITRVADALRADIGEAGTGGIFSLAGIRSYLEDPPQGMVAESEVIRLHWLLRLQLGDARAGRVAREAGRRTADYLLAHRIPNHVRLLLRMLPAALASPVLLHAISRHAWTFAGSGRFTARNGHPVQLEIAGNPLCRGTFSSHPVCNYYAATFEHLFRALVNARSTATEIACEAAGAPACVFEVGW